MIQPQTTLDWLAAISVPIAGWAIRSAMSVSRRFTRMELEFHVRKDLVERMDREQAKHGTQLVLHEERLVHVRSELANINNKLDVLPRIAIQMETWAPALTSFVPRLELEAKLKSIENLLISLRSEGKS